MDVMTVEQRHRCMSRIRCKNTYPEVTLRRALRANGLHYRPGNAVVGKPDVVFPSLRIAVFVDGCFWHQCPIHGTMPAKNQEFWRHKLGRNVQRDREIDATLSGAGWTVVRIWEHEIDSALDLVVRAILELVQGANPDR